MCNYAFQSAQSLNFEMALPMIHYFLILIFILVNSKAVHVLFVGGSE